MKFELTPDEFGHANVMALMRMQANSKVTNRMNEWKWIAQELRTKLPTIRRYASMFSSLILANASLKSIDKSYLAPYQYSLEKGDSDVMYVIIFAMPHHDGSSKQ